MESILFTARTMGLPLRSSIPGDLLIGGGQAGFDIRQENDDCGVFNGNLRLVPHEGQNLVVCTGLNAAGINQSKRTAIPVRLPINAVPVTPGVSSTMERRFPINLLNSMDLPTFGRPTMATMGFDISISLPGACWNNCDTATTAKR